MNSSTQGPFRNIFTKNVCEHVSLKIASFDVNCELNTVIIEEKIREKDCNRPNRNNCLNSVEIVVLPLLSRDEV